MKRAKTLLIAILVLLVVISGYYYLTQRRTAGLIIPTNSQSRSSQSKIAFIRDYNLWVSTMGQEQALTDDALVVSGPPYPYATAYYSHPSLSPDGTKIAFFKSVFAKDNRGNVYSLLLINSDGTDPKLLIDQGEFSRPYQPLWKNDNRTLLLDLNNQSTDLHRLVALDTESLAQAEITDYTITSGCGGGSSDPSTNLSGVEGARNYYSLNFNLSPDNRFLTHSLNCTGSGVALINLDTKEETTLNEQLSMTIFAPDSSLVAGIGKQTIQLYDVTTGKQVKTLNTTDQPDVLYWGTDQMLYYASSRLAQTLQAKDALGNTIEGRQNVASLWQISPDGQNTKLFDLSAHGLRPIYINPARVYLSVVDNPSDYFSAITDGQVDLTDFLPQVNFVTIDASSGAVLNSVARVEQADSFP